MVGLSPHSPRPLDTQTPRRRFANSVRPGVNLIDHGTDPEEAGQKTTKTFRARLSSRWEVRSLLFDRQTARLLRSLAVSRGGIRNSNPPVNLFFENLSHSIIER